MNKKESQRLYWRKHFAEIKADPARYEEYKRKERERVRRYRLRLKSGGIKMDKKTLSNDVEELKKEIKRLKTKEAGRKYYDKLKKDPERYQKYLARQREKAAKRQAAKKVEKITLLAAAHKVTEQSETIKPIDLSDSIKELDIKPFVDIKESEDKHSVGIAKPTLDEAYHNFREKIRKYFADVTAEYSILNAFELYMNVYKEDLLNKIKELFNK